MSKIELEEALDSLANLLVSKKDLEDKIDEVKKLVLEGNGLGKNIETEKLMVTYRSSHTNYNLTKDAKLLLLKEKPELFDKKEIEGGYTFKLKSEKTQETKTKRRSKPFGSYSPFDLKPFGDIYDECGPYNPNEDI
jgi:hypothetical protein